MSYMHDTFERFRQEAEPLLQQLSEVRESTVFPFLFHLQVNIGPWIISEVYDVLAQLEDRMKENVDIILFSTGGDADTAFHVGKMFHRVTKGDLSFIVPRCATSAATLLSLAGNKILMGPPSELGPIDPQIQIYPYRFVSARSLRETFDLFLERIVIHPSLPKPTVEALLERLPVEELVDYERLLEHTEELVIELLKLRMVKDESKAKQVAKKLVRGFKHHGRTITIDDVTKLGLSVEELPSKQWDIVWKLSKKWEALALMPAEAGSDILFPRIGDGIAFIPSKKAEKREDKESPISTVLSRL